MALSVGIVGLPNVGKSTIFNALTRAQHAEAANYPFCTIEANRAVVPVPDERLDAIARIVRPKVVTHATVDFVDIAGLVRGANKGEGLGNQFLANIREADAVMHVVRCFDDPDIVHVEGTVDPLRDIAIIETELILSDLQRLENRLDRIRKQARADKGAKELQAAVEALLEYVGEGHTVRTYPRRASEQLTGFFKEMQFLTDKQLIYCANVDEDGMGADNAYVEQVRSYAAARGEALVKISARIEAELGVLADAERLDFLSSYGIAEGGLAQVARTAYATLGLISYFTAGPKEVRAWAVREGCRAPQAAGVIHTDFERGFIRAQVIAYDAFIRHGGEAACKAAGVMRQEGKDYVVRDGDVMLFLFNVA